MSFRFAGAADPEQLWHLLRDGVDAVTRALDNRWETTGPQELPRWGSFLPDIAAFNADYFGITQRDAAVMFRQQRLDLELSWEALEDAGIVPAVLHGSRTVVFIGAMRDDYARLAQQ